MLVAADVEGTLTSGETWKAVGRYLTKHGRARAYRAFFLAHLPGALMVKARLLSRSWYRDRWMIDLARLLKDRDEEELRRMAEWVVERELWPLRRPSVIAELEAHRRGGASLILASATYQPVLEAFAERCTARPIGTPLELVDGIATGRIVGRVNSGRAKADRLTAAIQPKRVAIAYGDSASDIPMLELSAAPVAVQPDAGLRRLAARRGWRVLRA
jgi:phosphoserine phosphatase